MLLMPKPSGSVWCFLHNWAIFLHHSPSFMQYSLFWKIVWLLWHSCQMKKLIFFCAHLLVFIYLFNVSQINTNQFLSVWSILQALFDGSWHQLKVLVKPSHVTCFLDDQQIQDEALGAAVPIYINGKTQISKRFGSDATLPVRIASCCITEHWQPK